MKPTEAQASGPSDDRPKHAYVVTIGLTSRLIDAADETEAVEGMLQALARKHGLVLPRRRDQRAARDLQRPRHVRPEAHEPTAPRRGTRPVRREHDSDQAEEATNQKEQVMSSLNVTDGKVIVCLTLSAEYADGEIDDLFAVWSDDPTNDEDMRALVARLESVAFPSDLKR
jgi:hypothetical protein